MEELVEDFIDWPDDSKIENDCLKALDVISERKTFEIYQEDMRVWSRMIEIKKVL